LVAVAVVVVAVAQAHAQADWAEAVLLLGRRERLATRMPQAQVGRAAGPLTSLGPLAALEATSDRLVRPARHWVCFPGVLAAPVGQQGRPDLQGMLAIRGTQAPQ
jgi:hypothetical protein